MIIWLVNQHYDILINGNLEDGFVMQVGYKIYIENCLKEKKNYDSFQQLNWNFK